MNIVFRLIGIALLLIVFNGATYGQGWVKEWKTDSFNISYDIEEAINGDFIVSGYNTYQTNGPAYLTRLSPSGATVWERYVANFDINEIELSQHDTIFAAGTYFNVPALLKLDARGNVANIITYPSLSNNTNDIFREIKKTASGEFFAIVSHGPINHLFASVDTLSFVKLDTVGNILWVTSIPDTFTSSSSSYDYDFSPMEMSPTLDGGFILAAMKYNLISVTPLVTYNTAYLMKFNATGGVTWRKSFGEDEIFSVKETFDGGYIVSYESGIDAILSKLDSNGVVDWSTTIHYGLQSCWVSTVLGKDVIQCSDGNYMLLGEHTYDPEKLYLYKVDQQGNILWRRSIMGEVNVDYDAQKVKETSDGGYVILGRGHHYIYGKWMFVNKVDSAGRGIKGEIEGHIYADLNTDCNRDTLEYPLENWVVTAMDTSGQTYYANTNINGYYFIPAEPGTYEVTLNTPYPYWDTTCINLRTVTIDTVFDVDTVDFPVEVLSSCPLLQVDLSAPFLRRCFSSTYYVQYYNWGSVAQNAYVEVELDTFLSYDTSSIASTHLGGNLYRFDLGTVPQGYSGSFSIGVNILCDTAIAGMTHCSEARIYPDTVCLNTWTGPEIALDGYCQGDSISFQVSNTGGNMLSSLNYNIFEDNVMMLIGNYQLGTGQVQIINVPTQNGSTYRIEARQVPNYPSLLGDTIVGMSIEGCGVDSLGNISTGFVTQFSNYDASPFIDIDCQPNVASYDPNDKLAYPVGYGAEHYIYDHTDLEYYIRFQNTGTDTAFTVVLIDTISPHLNIATLQAGASSHNYRYEIYGNGIVKFTFDNILLPDSTTNNSASQGFVKYRIEQRVNNPIGTIINNHADIYFDYNPPVRTNTTFHEIGSDFVTVMLVGLENVLQENVLVNVYPNPFHEIATVEIEGEEFSKVEFELYDLTGRVVYQKTSSENSFNINKSDLIQGVYVYRIVADGKLLNTGKLIAR